jgi:hypothetical protein
MTYAEMERLAESVAKSRLFGIATKEQAIVLMCVAQAEGRHPVLAARDYDIIQGRPAKKSEAMLRDFLEAGGKVTWERLDDNAAIGIFEHPAGGKARIEWDMDRARKAKLTGKDNWQHYPRAMLRSRVVSEGIRTVYPAATSGMYETEEERDIDRRPQLVEAKVEQPVSTWLDPDAPISEDRVAEIMQLKDEANLNAEQLEWLLNRMNAADIPSLSNGHFERVKTALKNRIKKNEEIVQEEPGAHEPDA